MICGLAAGAGLGAAEAPTKLVTLGLSPFLISLGMVAGVFVARWTVPMVLKGSDYVWADLRQKPHLVVWALLAGMIWAVANTLTVFAIREVGLSVAFPLWNTNSLVGLFWGWLLFRELRDAGSREWAKVLGGAAAIVVGACLTGLAMSHSPGGASRSAVLGIAAALCAGLLWGTMYIPYRKAYISGMNPLSFVTVFTFAELGTVLLLAVVFEGGVGQAGDALTVAQPGLFWLFLGGFCWVIGDLYQQYAAKYIGIGRGIPLSNTNQLWGLAWGVLVFGEFAGLGGTARLMVVTGSLVMIAGAVSISLAEAQTGRAGVLARGDAAGVRSLRARRSAGGRGAGGRRSAVGAVIEARVVGVPGGRRRRRHLRLAGDEGRATEHPLRRDLGRRPDGDHDRRARGVGMGVVQKDQILVSQCPAVGGLGCSGGRPFGA